MMILMSIAAIVAAYALCWMGWVAGRSYERGLAEERHRESTLQRETGGVSNEAEQ